MIKCVLKKLSPVLFDSYRYLFNMLNARSSKIMTISRFSVLSYWIQILRNSRTNIFRYIELHVLNLSFQRLFLFLWKCGKGKETFHSEGMHVYFIAYSFDNSDHLTIITISNISPFAPDRPWGLIRNRNIFLKSHLLRQVGPEGESETMFVTWYRDELRSAPGSHFCFGCLLNENIINR